MNSQSRKKKTAINPYGCFVLEYKRKQEAQGRRITQSDAFREAGPVWEKMNEWERAPFEQEAKIQKAHCKAVGAKFTSQGIPLEVIENDKRAKQRAIDEMEAYIENKLQMAVLNSCLDKEPFFFLSTNYFCQTIHGEIFPAEIGISKYSLREGIIDSTHMFVNPGKLPLGTSNDAQEHSQKTHRLPIPPSAKGNTSYYDIFSKILDFIHDGTTHDFPVFFTNSDELKETKMIMDKIAKEAEELELDIKVYAIENLFYPLKKHTVQLKNESNGTNDKPFPSIYIAKDMIDRDKYRYSLNLGCNYHDMEDCSTFCSLSKVKRWGFVISDYCVNDLRIKFIPGQHVPRNCDVDVDLPGAEKTSNDDYDSFKNKAKEKSPVRSGKDYEWGRDRDRDRDNQSWNRSTYDDNASSTRYPGLLQQSDFPDLSETRSVSDQSNFSRQKALNKLNNVKPTEQGIILNPSFGRGMASFSTASVSSVGAGRGLPRTIPKYN